MRRSGACQHRLLMRMSALLDRWGTDCIGSERGERGGDRGQVECAVVVGGVVGCADVTGGVVGAGGALVLVSTDC